MIVDAWVEQRLARILALRVRMNASGQDGQDADFIRAALRLQAPAQLELFS